MEEELFHYGTPRHSGRYPYGSGENPYQHEAWSFVRELDDFRDSGLSEIELARAMGCKNVAELRKRKSLYLANMKADRERRALELKDKGYSNAKIGELMAPYNDGQPFSESTIRGILTSATSERTLITNRVAEELMRNVDEKGYIDVGAGVDREMGIKESSFKTALYACEEKGYVVQDIQVPQAGNPKQKTTIRVMAPPGTTAKDIYKNRENIQSVEEYTQDNGKTFYNIEYPRSIDSKRVYIRYGDEGGSDLDGVVYLRPGVDDISLGDSSYAQVRIAVDNSHYMKGMAMYSNDIPDGYDVVYNTNKKSGTDKYSVFKPMKTIVKDGEEVIDPDNPFGAELKKDSGQRHYKDKDGKDQLSMINKIKDEGDWAEYSKSLAAQMLSKQNESLIKRQLDLSYLEKKDELDDIMTVSNPTVRKALLEAYADSCDKSASELKAAALPRQCTQVILPVPSMRDDQIYAPNFRDGEQVALIRYPHGGIFEIPILTVNNKQPDAKSLIGQAKDAVGINSKVAAQLSGADFDGDTVVVIPTNNNVRIRASKPLEALKDFDSKQYKFTQEELDAGAKVISNKTKQNEMGRVSNLITDMTLKGATDDEIARAVKHSMVVIDAEKHKLNYKKSEEDNNIQELKKKYQMKENGRFGGASTLISQAGSEVRINERKDGVRGENGVVQYIDPKTGKKLYTDTNRTYVNKQGKTVVAQEKVSKMDLHDDAFELSSGTKKEAYYANYANQMKALANTARKLYLSAGDYTTSKSAKDIYKAEVASLDAKLNIALKNAPRERQAQIIASGIIKTKKAEKKAAGIDISDEDMKKIRSQAISYGRAVTGAKKQSIDISAKEWEAISAGAISNTNLTKILANTQLDLVKSYAVPRDNKQISSTKIARMKNMQSSGLTASEIADSLGLSVSTVNKYLSGKEK